MASFLKKPVELYAQFISRHPLIIVLLVCVLIFVAVIGSGRIELKGMDNSDMLPDTLEVMKAFNILNDGFGGDNSVMIAIELDPEYIGSNEIRDVRDPELIKYIDLLEQSAEHIDYVQSVSGAASILRSLNAGTLPKSKRKILELSANNVLFDQYFSRDYELAVIRIGITENYDVFELEKGLNHIIKSVPKPAGIVVSPAGEVIADAVIQDSMGTDMSKTSSYSLIGIVLVLVLLFRSVKYSFTPLATIGVGVIWAFGYIGFMGIEMTSATSGVISMIMGIGIDFGIQTISRFRQELKNKTKEEALKVTMSNVVKPMATTTLAALIGFKAMGMGTLSLMGDMAKMMSYGVAACFLAAITIIPALLILAERADEIFIKLKKDLLGGKQK